MNAPSPRFACFAGISLLLLTFDGWADSWVPPRGFESRSENGRFVAQIIPAKGEIKGTVVVYRAAGAQRGELWRAQLSNKVSPISAHISDDGEAVVTLDNWYRGGYGDDVVAFYGRKGQMSKYGLEDLAVVPARHSPRLQHSTSSRQWLRHATFFFLRDNEFQLFCLWLDWDKRWLVWDTATGKPATTPAGFVERCGEGRRRALDNIRNGSASAADLNSLARTRMAEDRALIEDWLTDKDFFSGSMEISGGKKDSYFAYTSRSQKRHEADNILARWDRLEGSDLNQALDTYFYLGILKGTVVLSEPPEKRGSLYLYLVPERIPVADWARNPPNHYLRADLAHGPRTHPVLANEINFHFYGVTPGKYNIVAVWDKTAPFCNEEQRICPPGAGDVISRESMLIEVVKGQSTRDIRILCTHTIVAR